MEEEFELDADMDEIEETIKALAREIEEQEQEPQVLNLPRMHQMVQAYKQLQCIACDDWKITTMVHKPLTSMGTICIEAEDLVFDQMKVISNALANASNMEIFPLTNGKIRMTITFHGLTTIID